MPHSAVNGSDWATTGCCGWRPCPLSSWNDVASWEPRPSSTGPVGSGWCEASTPFPETTPPRCWPQISPVPKKLSICCPPQVQCAMLVERTGVEGNPVGCWRRGSVSWACELTALATYAVKVAMTQISARDISLVLSLDNPTQQLTVLSQSLLPSRSFATVCKPRHQ